MMANLGGCLCFDKLNVLGVDGQGSKLRTFEVMFLFRLGIWVSTKSC